MRLLGPQFAQQALRRVERPQVTAQHRIDEPRLRAEAGMFGQFDGFMDRGMIGDSLEPEDLVQTQSEEILQPGLLRARAGFSPDQPIQRRPPANHPIHQFLAQPPVRGRQPGAA